MKLIGAAIVVIVIVAIFFFSSKYRSGRAEAADPSYNVNLFGLLSEAKAFRPDDLVKAFKDTWGMPLVCAEAKGIAAENETSKGYAVGNGPDKHNLFLTWSAAPLSEDRTRVLLKAAQGGFVNGIPISQPDIALLRDHKAHFQLDYILGPRNPKERMAFCAKLLLTLIKLYPFSGCVNSSAQAYTPLSRIPAHRLEKQDITAIDLFSLFINVHTISDKDNVEIHTHGMDQFWLPDVQIVSRTGDLSYNYDVLRNAAVYMIEKERAMNPGDTGEPAGDGVVFKAIAIKPDMQHPFGTHGVIRLTKQELLQRPGASDRP